MIKIYSALVLLTACVGFNNTANSQVFNLLKDINTTVGTQSSNPASFAATGTVVYFIATTVTEGEELWKSDGTAVGSVFVKDIYAGINGSTPQYLTNVNGVLYFTADNGFNGRELWKSDGTAAGTVLVKDIYTGINSSNPQSLINVTACFILLPMTQPMVVNYGKAMVQLQVRYW